MEFFLKKQHGVITVMISLILVGVMSTSSLLMEAAKYRSSQAILKEITDSAAFSMLSGYDSDVLSRFGLLAMNSDKVSKEKFISYLNANTGNALENANSIENMFEIMEDGTDLETIYSLNDLDVFRRQVLEAAKYRVPVNTAMEVLDIDGLMKELENKIKEALPFLNVIKEWTQMVEKLLKTIKSANDCNESLDSLKTNQKAFEDKYNEWNKVLGERRNTESNLNKEEEKKNNTIQKKENYVNNNQPQQPAEPDIEEPEMSESLKEYVELQKEENAEKDDEMEEEIKQYNKEVKQYNDAQEQYQKDIKQYEKQVNKYEKQISKYDKEIDKHNSEIDHYKEKINEYNSNLKTLQAEFLNIIKDFKKAIGTYLQKTTEFKTNLDSFAAQGMQMIISDNRKEYRKELENSSTIKGIKDEKKREEAINKELETYDSNTAKMQKATKDFEGVFNQLEDAFNTVFEKKLDEEQQKLTEYYTVVENIKVKEYNQAKFPFIEISLTSALLANAVSDVLQPFSILETLVEQLIKGIQKICAVLGLISEAFTNFSAYDTDYNVTIEEQYFNNLPSKKNMELTKSENDSADRNKMKDLLDASQDVANKTGYDINALSLENRGDNTENAVETDIDNMANDFSKICEYESILKSITSGLIKKMVTFIKFVKTVFNLIVHTIQFCKHLLQNPLKVIYNSILITQYAAGMFSDRITTKDGKNLKGQKFSKYAINYGNTNQVPLNGIATLRNDIEIFGESVIPSSLLKNEDISFSGAQLEYIWGGKKSELENQKSVYVTLMIVRFILNIPACASNETVQLSFDIPIVGVIVYLLWVLLESVVDVKIMTFLRDKVPLLKGKDDVYLSASGISKLAKKVKKGFEGLLLLYQDDDKGKKEQVKKEQEKSEKLQEKAKKDLVDDMEKDYNNGQETKKEDKEEKKFEVGYSGYLNAMLYFRSNRTKLRRMQDLVQMEIGRKKQKAGELQQFELKNAFTYIRVRAKAKYKPVLPMPDISGANDGYLTVEDVYYAGY